MEKGSDGYLCAEVVTTWSKIGWLFKNLEVSWFVEKEETDGYVEAYIERERNNLAELVIKEAAAKRRDTCDRLLWFFIRCVELRGGKGENLTLTWFMLIHFPVWRPIGRLLSWRNRWCYRNSFPEDYQAEDLAGKEAKFVTTIHDKKAKEVRSWDDELAKDIDGSWNTLADLKEKYRKELGC